MDTSPGKDAGGGGAPLSAMLDAKNTRIRAEADMKLLQNRLAHLTVAEERARKKISETKARTQEIVSLKKRNVDHAGAKRAQATEREVSVAATRKAVAHNRKSMARHVAASRAEVEGQRKREAESTRSRLRELGGVAAANGDDLKSRNKLRNEQARRERDEARRRKEQARLEQERKRQEEYARKVEEETRRAVEAEKLIQDMAVQEQELIERLRSTQDMQRAAYEELQASLQL